MTAAMPLASGWLDVGDGHRIYWETHGSPAGQPAVVLHGGPGSGASASQTGLFPSDAFHVVLFDQRGCGRSTPHAAADDIDLSTNTTACLVADIERLRVHFAIEDWLVVANSWGTTLGLAYAAAHPGQVRAMVLAGVTTTSAEEVAWITRGVARFFPEAWERFAGHVPEAGADGRLVDAYHRRLMHPDPAVHHAAAAAWAAWEVALAGGDPRSRWDDAAFRLAFARLVTHYWRHQAWLGPDLVRRVAERASFPAILVNGRLDLAAPLETAWRLHRAWPGSELVVVEAAGHDLRAPSLREAVVAAIARICETPTKSTSPNGDGIGQHPRR